MDRILVIRGGAIGDFILTLPSLKALRDAHPDAHIEILGYKHIAALAENRFYAQAVRSIEYAPLSIFFARNLALSTGLADYFSNFDLIVSYLYDPDRIFEKNLCRCGVENLLCGPAKILETAGHAARQLARPIEDLGIKVPDLSEKVFPSVDDQQFARELLGSLQQPIIAIHPGSGGADKNWPLENWIGLFSRRAAFTVAEEKSRQTGNCFSLIVVSGEADEAQTERLEREWKIVVSGLLKTCRCLIWPRCLNAPSSSGTTAESRISPQLPAQIAFCCSARLIRMFGRLRTAMCESLLRQTAGLLI